MSQDLKAQTPFWTMCERHKNSKWGLLHIVSGSDVLCALSHLLNEYLKCQKFFNGILFDTLVTQRQLYSSASLYEGGILLT